MRESEREVPVVLDGQIVSTCRVRLTTIFVEGISRECKEMDLWEVFSPLGTVIDIFIPRQNSMARGFSFARSRHPVNLKSLLEMNPKILVGSRRLRLD